MLRLGFAILIACIVVGARAGTIGLGAISGIGLPAHLFLGGYPAVNGTFFPPTHGTVLAVVSMDQTGTVRIGEYLLNHSFLLPGLVTTIASTATALALSSVLVN